MYVNIYIEREDQLSLGQIIDIAFNIERFFSTEVDSRIYIYIYREREI